jgi:hypothetical protein
MTTVLTATTTLLLLEAVVEDLVCKTLVTRTALLADRAVVARMTSAETPPAREGTEPMTVGTRTLLPTSRVEATVVPAAVNSATTALLVDVKEEAMVEVTSRPLTVVVPMSSPRAVRAVEALAAVEVAEATHKTTSLLEETDSAAVDSSPTAAVEETTTPLAAVVRAVVVVVVGLAVTLLAREAMVPMREATPSPRTTRLAAPTVDLEGANSAMTILAVVDTEVDVVTSTKGDKYGSLIRAM